MTIPPANPAVSAIGVYSSPERSPIVEMRTRYESVARALVTCVANMAINVTDAKFLDEKRRFPLGVFASFAQVLRETEHTVRLIFG